MARSNVNLADMRQRLTKTNEQLMKLKVKNRRMEMTLLVYRCLNGEGLENLSTVDLNEMLCFVNQFISNIEKTIEFRTQRCAIVE